MADASKLVVEALGDYDDFSLLPRSTARHVGLIPRRGGLLLPHNAGEAIKRPGLIVMCGWLMATDKTIQTYLDIYRAQGCDVLWFPVHPLHILVPDSGQALARRLLAITEILLLHPRKLMFHLLSAGAYMFGQMLQVLSSGSQISFGRVRRALSGLIFDSSVDVVGIPAAASDILGFAKGSMGWRTIHAILNGYFLLSYPLTRSKLLRASNNVRHLEGDWLRKVPQMWLYCEDDRVADPRVIENVIECQRRNGVDLEIFKWDRSEHVKHIIHHKDEYCGLILDFMLKVGTDLETNKSYAHSGTVATHVRPVGAALSRL